MRISLARRLFLCPKYFVIKTSVNLSLPSVRNFITIISNNQHKYLVQHKSSVHHSTASVPHSQAQSEEMDVQGVPLSQVLETLESFAPSTLAEKWDNVGLLVEPEMGNQKKISKILLTNDLTEDVLYEAVTENCNMIISYHPPIFEAVKRVTSATWKGRILKACLLRDIAVYSPHTSWDAVDGGVNDWLLQAFDAFKPTSKPLRQRFEANLQSTHVAEAIVPIDKSSSLVTKIKETISLGNVGASPYHTENGDFVKITIPCNMKDIVPLSGVLQSFPHTFTRHEENPVLNHGSGRSCTLGTPQKLRDIVKVVKNHLGVPDLSLALARGADMDTVITTVAVCAGSGGSVLKGQKADLFVTGEMSHHEVLDAVHQGVNVILSRHSNSERGFLQRFSVYLNKHLSEKVNIIVSSRDKDPLDTV